MMQHSITQLQDLKSEKNQYFIKKVKLFLENCRHQNVKVVKIIRKGYGFAFLNSQERSNELRQIIEDIFQFSVKDFIRQASRKGFTIKESKKAKQQVKVISFLCQVKLIEDLQQHDEIQIEDDSNQVEKIKQEEEFYQNIAEKWSEKERGSIKSNIILNKFHSDNHLVECKKEENQFDRNKDQEDFLKQIQSESVIPFDQICPLSLNQRIKLEKSNYQKCGKLIQGTIVELLEAHRAKSIQEKKDELLQKVVEIYDMLSDGIENSGEALHLASSRKELRSAPKEQSE